MTSIRGWRRERGEDAQLVIEVSDAPVHEVSRRLCSRVELEAQLAWRPDVIVVEEGDPLPASSCHATVPSSCDARASFVANRAHAVVVEGGQSPRCLVGRTVVDDDHLEAHVLLTQRRREPARFQQAPSIAGRYHDADLRTWPAHVRLLHSTTLCIATISPMLGPILRRW